MPSYEDNVKLLEEIVKKLEDKNISLDDLVNNYTKGLELVKECYNILQDKEKAVTLKMTELGLEEFKGNTNQEDFEKNM